MDTGGGAQTSRQIVKVIHHCVALNRSVPLVAIVSADHGQL